MPSRSNRIAAAASLGAIVSLLACATMESPSVRHANVNGTTLEYLEQGRGSTVLMVHGGISDHRVWELQREVIAKGHRYVALDLRYFGTRPWPDDGSKFSFTTHLEDLAAFIQSLGAAPVDVVAWSYGASLALALAVHHPLLVKGLFIYEPAPGATRMVVTDPAFRHAVAEAAKGLGPAVAAVKANDAAQATRLFSEWVNNQAPGEFESNTPAWLRRTLLDNARSVAPQMAAPPPLPITCEQLGQIKVPVVVAKGQQTRTTFSMLAEGTARCIRDAKLVTIPDSTHSAPTQNPAAFNREVSVFLTHR